MTDRKYGRVFTEDDVRQIVQWAIENEIETETELSAYLGEFEGKFPADEPTFTLRARDQRAIGALAFYRSHQSHTAPANHLDGIQAAVNDFDRYREENRELMREPD